MTGDDTAMVGGDYYLSARGGEKISGHFFQVLIPAASTDDSAVNWCGSTGCDSQSLLDGGNGDGGIDYATGAFGG